MAGDHWTFVVLKGEGEPIRQYQVSRASLRRLGWFAGTLALAFLVLLAGIGFGGASRMQAQRLAEENNLLTRELDRMKGQVERLDGTLGYFSELDQQMRVMAGLDPIDAEVLEVGIGGPGTRTPRDLPLWGVDSTLTKETFAVSYDLHALERRVTLLESSFTEARDSLQAHRDLLLSTPSILPATGWLSSGFSRSRMHPILHTARPHEGLDISAPRGTPIMAAAAGRVVYAGRKGDLGLTVEIDHGYGYLTRYGHADKLLVREGQRVARGDVIAQVGKSGLSTSSHLHYEVLVDGSPVNPMNFVVDGALP